MFCMKQILYDPLMFHAMYLKMVSIAMEINLKSIVLTLVSPYRNWLIRTWFNCFCTDITIADRIHRLDLDKMPIF